MMVANSFDLWEKDTFFSAAEEVQESTDIMESVYRTWFRQRTDDIGPEDFEELRRELQISLGTAKWQLEEFERAVRLSYGNRPEDNTTARHDQFIAAIEEQIHRVEKALIESHDVEGKQPLRWVNLDEEERDDLASFLSRAPGTAQVIKEGNDQRRKRVADFHIDPACRIEKPDCVVDFKQVATLKQDSNYVVEIEARESPGTMDDLSCEVEKSNGHRRTWSTPNFGSWKIVIADDDEDRKTLLDSDESMTKGKGFKNNFWKLKTHQIFGRVGGSQRQIQGPQHMQFTSLRLVLMIVLAFFLLVPFVFYTR